MDASAQRHWASPGHASAEAVLLGLVLAGGLALGTGPVARAAESATVQEILDGNELYIDRKPARVKEKASTPQQVSTGDSRGQLAFAGGAAGRLNRFSQLRLGASCFLLDKGQILVSGKQNGCTKSSRMSVRGTNYVIEVSESGDAELSVLEGSVEVAPSRDGEPTGAAPTVVEAGQKVRLSPLGVVLALLKLSPSDYTNVLNGPLFKGFSTTLPGFGSLESYIRSSVPGVSIPGVPGIPLVPSLPSFSLPRFF
ncbi:FecR domain-containing protein [Cyanobium sp. Morenito 9A2]|uniref:FecR domain-containing protein n=1 Tax=Cyanobium sp. Morenito 9A2 TaxID=2823718 RepID=UPI0020CC8FD5|nr:FecR domain-containing protein [Cyanobium sp. Morenito 9A2]MCP9850044.1 FecR domain-containing protein [Cyanobium sp. Morenito 9A2]